MRKMLQLTAIFLALSLTACGPSGAPVSSSEPSVPVSSTVEPVSPPDSSEPAGSETASAPDTSGSDVSGEVAADSLTARQDWSFSQNLTDVEAQLDIGSLTMEAGDTLALTAEDFNPQWLSVEERDGTLYLSYQLPDGLSVGDRADKHRFVLTLPEGHQVKETSCEIKTGEMSLRQLTIPQVDLSVAVGNFQLQNVSSETLDLSVDVGNIAADNLVVAKHTDLELKTGNFSLSGDLSGEIQLDSSTGHGELYLRQPRDAYAISGKVSNVGSIQVDNEPFAGSDEVVDGRHLFHLEGGTSRIQLWFDFKEIEA